VPQRPETCPAKAEHTWFSAIHNETDLYVKIYFGYVRHVSNGVAVVSAMAYWPLFRDLANTSAVVVGATIPEKRPSLI
jgi:hypothetical protein